MLNITKKMNKN